MMYNFIMSGILFFAISCACGQPGIDYSHKKIGKEIERIWEIEQPTIDKINIPDSILHKINIQGKYFSVTNSKNVSQIYYMYIGRVNSCRAGGCSISMDPIENFETEYFDYLILFDNELKIQVVRIFNYAATHGHEVTTRGWLKQFDGYNGTGTLVVGKNVDAISGATISVYGITEDVQLKTQLLKQLNKKSKLTSNN